MLRDEDPLCLPALFGGKSRRSRVHPSACQDAIRQGVRVNALAPGYVHTPMLEVLTPPLQALVQLQKPIGRLGRVEEIAAAAVFLASDEASFFVGETIRPNGGMVTV